MASKKINTKPRKSNGQSSLLSGLSGILSVLNNQEDKVHFNTYDASNTVKKEIEKDLGYYGDVINSIVDDTDELGVNSNILDLLSSEAKKTKNTGEFEELQKFLSDSGNSTMVENLYKVNLSRNQRIQDYRMVTAYMTQLQDVIDTFADNILSPDDSSKLNMYIAAEGQNSKAVNETIKRTRKKYDLNAKTKNIVIETLKEGEQFYICMPYDRAFAKLIAAKDSRIIRENFTYALNESTLSKSRTYDPLVFKKSEIAILESYSPELVNEHGNQGIEKLLFESVNAVRIHSNEDYLPEFLLSEVNIAYNKQDILAEAFTEEDTLKEYQKLINKDTPKPDKLISANDGMKTADELESKIKLKGCVVKKLKTENVVPIYLNGICLGFYYLEISENIERETDIIKNPLARVKYGKDEHTANARDIVLSKFSDLLTKRLDVNFVNANPNFKEIIYQFCSENEVLSGKKTMKITYFSPEDIIHFRINPDDDGRGVSLLERSVFYAKLFIAILTANIMMKITRSFDKRAYYIRQGIDTNSAQSVMDVIMQIKKSQFGLNDISNLNKITNVIGRFNDFFIPITAGGDKPIDFDIIAGQDVEVKTDFLDFLERMAISSTGMPSNFLDTRSDIDFAKQLGMLNQKVLMRVISLQVDLQMPLEKFISRIIYSEMDEDCTATITTTLPPPSSLNMTNTMDQLQNAMQVKDNITQNVLGDSPDEGTAKEFNRLLMQLLCPQIEWDKYQAMAKEAELRAKGESLDKTDTAEQ